MGAQGNGGMVSYRLDKNWNLNIAIIDVEYNLRLDKVAFPSEAVVDQKSLVIGDPKWYSILGKMGLYSQWIK
jgi:hypothetical protein